MGPQEGGAGGLQDEVDDSVLCTPDIANKQHLFFSNKTSHGSQAGAKLGSRNLSVQVSFITSDVWDEEI